MSEYIGKHARLNVDAIQRVSPGAYFHGEVWGKCPYCGEAYELQSTKHLCDRNGWRIYRCSKCKGLFKDR